MGRKQPRFSQGRWMIERERCGISVGTPAPQKEGATDMTAGIRAVFSDLGMEDESWTTQLIVVWAEVVGAQVASHTRPGRMRERELVVYVDSPVWLNELSRYGLKSMCSNIQARFGANRVSKIRLQLDPDG